MTGYRRPPPEHRFKPGQSGNPSGRPKGRTSFQSDLNAELGEICSVSDCGKLVQVTKQRAVVKSMVLKAIEGDPRAIATIVTACAALFDDDEAEAPEDQAILEVAGSLRRKDADRVQKGSLPTEDKNDS